MTFPTWNGFDAVSATRYRVTKPVTWDIGRKGSGWALGLPVGYTFDLSVPLILTPILSRHDRTALGAAAVHDRLLEGGHDAAFASSEFRRALRARGVGRLRAWVMFLATLAVTAWRRRNTES